MSTTFMIGRCPAAISRCFSHSGDGPIFTSSNTRAVKRRQISGSMSIEMWSPAVSSPAGTASASVGSSARGADVVACRSRATPYTPIASGRFGVISISITSSAIGRCSDSGPPTGSSPDRTMMPSWSSPIPTSSSARIIPLDFTPRSFASPSVAPSGITAPGSATATV